MTVTAAQLQKCSTLSRASHTSAAGAARIPAGYGCGYDTGQQCDRSLRGPDLTQGFDSVFDFFESVFARCSAILTVRNRGKPHHTATPMSQMSIGR